MKVLTATKAHLHELAQLERQYMEHHVALDDYFAFKENITEMWLKHAQRLIDSALDLILIAVEDDQIVGYMTGHIRKNVPIYQIEERGQIGDNFVLPQYRRRGIFTQLLKAMLEWMQRQGIKYVEHPIAVKNEVGRIAWKKRGFEDLYIMTKKRIASAR
jgi:GNAT superfamily N-acetyltransferase